MNDSKNRNEDHVNPIGEAHDFYNKYMGSRADSPLTAHDLDEDTVDRSATEHVRSRRWEREIEECKQMTRRALSGKLGFAIAAPRRTVAPWHFGLAVTVLVLVGLVLSHHLPSASRHMQLLAHCAGDTTLTLPDGTRVDLQAGSTLSIADDFGRSSRVVSMRGQAFFDVATDSSLLFSVESGALHAVVHGTSFNVLARPGEALCEVTVSSGCVEVKAARDGHALGRYHHGDQIAYDAATGRETVRRVDVPNMTEWKRGEFHLTDATMEQFCEKMRRQFGVEVVMERGAVSPSARINCSVTATRPTVSNVMESFCAIFGVRYRQSGSRVIIAPADER